MAISEPDIKMLWGRAAGICSNPQCGRELTALLPGGDGYNVGEMAHVIARQPGGPRGVPAGGPDTYANLILLCPTCHRMIDKAPADVFPADMLFQWKEVHEARVQALGADIRFSSKEDLWRAISRLLQENHLLWRNLGPHSDAAQANPGSNLFVVWNLRKLDTIVPNNRKIINYIESNKALLSDEELGAYFGFKMHAQAFEAHQYNRTEDYPLFPEEFGRMFR